MNTCADSKPRGCVDSYSGDIPSRKTVAEQLNRTVRILDCLGGSLCEGVGSTCTNAQLFRGSACSKPIHEKFLPIKISPSFLPQTQDSLGGRSCMRGHVCLRAHAAITSMSSFSLSIFLPHDQHVYTHFYTHAVGVPIRAPTTLSDG